MMQRYYKTMIAVRYRVRSLIFENNLKIFKVLFHFFHVFILKNLEFSAESFGPTDSHIDDHSVGNSESRSN